MALSYTGQFRIPDTETFTGCNTGIWYQRSTGGSGPYASLNIALTAFKTELELDHGGTFSWTTVTSGGIITIDIVFTGLTNDPLNDPLTLELQNIYIMADLGSIYSAAMIPAATNSGTGTEDCTDCYGVTVIDCDTDFTLQGLDGVTQYTFDIEDENTGVHYTYVATTDAFGEATVTVANFPAGLFNPYTTYTVTVTDAAGDLVQATIGYTNYNCYQLTFIISTDYTP